MSGSLTLNHGQDVGVSLNHRFDVRQSVCPPTIVFSVSLIDPCDLGSKGSRVETEERIRGVRSIYFERRTL